MVLNSHKHLFFVIYTAGPTLKLIFLVWAKFRVFLGVQTKGIHRIVRKKGFFKSVLVYAIIGYKKKLYIVNILPQEGKQKAVNLKCGCV